MKKKILVGLGTIFLLSIITISSVGAYFPEPLPPPPPPPVDSDGDGLSNSQEIYIYDTDPYDSDTDNDGLNDYKEVRVWFTDPNDKDTDNDGLTDKQDVDYGYDPLVAEATNMFVHNGQVYCGVAFLAWVQDYSTRQNWYDICTQGNCVPLDSASYPSYNYGAALRARGYLVITVADFTIDSFFDGYQKALCFADYYNTRLFVVSHAHGYVFGGFSTYDESEVINVATFTANLFNPILVSSTRLNALGIGYMAGKLNGGITEIVYYIASCFALAGYGEFIPSVALVGLFQTYAVRGAILGVYATIAKFGDVSGFRTNYIINGDDLWPAYWDACWTILCAALPWGGLNAYNHELVTI